MTIFYLHGFNSDGGGQKYDHLLRHFPQATVIAPDLSPNPLEVKSQILALINDHKAPFIFVGTSLGGFYAWYFGVTTHSKAYLYNPSLSPNITLDDRGIGHFETWIKKRPYHFKREYLAHLATLKAEAKQVEDQTLLHFFLGTNDDVLDHSQVEANFPDAAMIKWYEGVSHRFTAFKNTLEHLTF